MNGDFGKYVQTRQLSWTEYDAAADWLFKHFADVTAVDRYGEVLDKRALTLSKLVQLGKREPECIGMTIQGLDELVVEWTMRWG